MGRDLGIGVERHGPPELDERLLVPPHAVEHPPQGIDDVVIVGLELDRTFDERIGFLVAIGAIGEGVSQGVEGIGVVRLARDDVAHVAFEEVQPVHLHPEHPARIEEVRVPGELPERCIVDRHRFAVALRAREQPRLGAVDAHPLPGAPGSYPVQMAPRRFQVAALREQHRGPDLRVQSILAAADAPVRRDRVLQALFGLRDPGEVVVRRIAPRGRVREHLELPRRLVEPVRLHQQQPERVAGVVVFGLFRHQALELGARLIVTSRIDEQARIGHADHARIGDALDECLQPAERAFDVVRALAYARAQDRRPGVVGIELVRAVDRRRRLLDPPRPNEEPGKRKLRRRVVLMPADKPLHRGGRHLRVLLRGQEVGGAQKPRARRIGQRLHDLFKVRDRPVDVAGPDQQGGEHLPGLDARRLGFAPQARRIEGLLLIAREHRELGRPRRDARVPGLPGDLQIAVERERHLAAIAGEFPDQQLVEDLPGQPVARRVRGADAAGVGRGRSGRGRSERGRAGGGAGAEHPHGDGGDKRERPEPLPGRREQPFGCSGRMLRRSYGHRRPLGTACSHLRASPVQCVPHYTSCRGPGNRHRHDAGRAAPIAALQPTYPANRHVDRRPGIEPHHGSAGAS